MKPKHVEYVKIHVQYKILLTPVRFAKTQPIHPVQYVTMVKQSAPHVQTSITQVNSNIYEHQTYVKFGETPKEQQTNIPGKPQSEPTIQRRLTQRQYRVQQMYTKMFLLQKPQKVNKTKQIQKHKT